MKKKLTTVAFLSFFVGAAGQAHAQKDTSYKYIKRAALDYSRSIGCADEQLDPKLVSRYSDKGNALERLYVAAVITDMECAGGSGTGAMRLVLVGKAKMRATDDSDPDLEYLRVYPELSEPTAAVNGAPRLITSLYMKDGQLHATGLEYGDKDSNCCPSMKAIYKVSLSKKDVTLTNEDSRSLYTWTFIKIKTY